MPPLLTSRSAVQPEWTTLTNVRSSSSPKTTTDRPATRGGGSRRAECSPHRRRVSTYGGLEVVWGAHRPRHPVAWPPASLQTPQLRRAEQFLLEPLTDATPATAHRCRTPPTTTRKCSTGGKSPHQSPPHWPGLAATTPLTTTHSRNLNAQALQAERTSLRNS